jgi:dTDP-4-dehydrorhamnose 3,5-epimerase
MMRMRALPIAGCWLVEPEEHRDERGSFGRVFCDQELRAHGLEARVAQVNVSWNERRGTLRGLHVRDASNPECKLVRVTRGRVFDVLVDVRPGSSTWGRWHGVELDDRSHAAVWICEGVAHGFVTLEDDVELLYLHNRPHAPRAETGYRWDDPAFAIDWPVDPVVISERDRSWAPATPTQAAALALAPAPCGP